MPDGAEGRADSKEFTSAHSRHPESLQLHRLFRLMGCSKVARHRPNAITVYRQGDIDYLVNEEPNTQAARFSIDQHCPLTPPTEHNRWDRLFKRTQAGLRSRQRAMQVANAKILPIRRQLANNLDMPSRGSGSARHRSLTSKGRLGVGAAKKFVDIVQKRHAPR